jgi:hypothetical protein
MTRRITMRDILHGLLKKSETTPEMAPVHPEAPSVKRGLSTPERRANYKRQNAGRELTGPQKRRLAHKQGHRRKLAAKRRRIRGSQR